MGGDDGGHPCCLEERQNRRGCAAVLFPLRRIRIREQWLDWKSAAAVETTTNLLSPTLTTHSPIPLPLSNHWIVEPVCCYTIREEKGGAGGVVAGAGGAAAGSALH